MAIHSVAFVADHVNTLDSPALIAVGIALKVRVGAVPEFEVPEEEPPQAVNARVNVSNTSRLKLIR